MTCVIAARLCTIASHISDSCTKTITCIYRVYLIISTIAEIMPLSACNFVVLDKRFKKKNLWQN